MKYNCILEKSVEIKYLPFNSSVDPCIYLVCELMDFAKIIKRHV